MHVNNIHSLMHGYGGWRQAVLWTAEERLELASNN
jgi:hypothetical protein